MLVSGTIKTAGNLKVQDHAHKEKPRQNIPLDIARYRKAASSAMCVQFT